MNGVSHMLPFVVGGGILIALAFLIDGLCVDMTSLTAEARQSFGSITPVAATLKSIGDLAFGFMLPVLAGFIAMSIADRLVWQSDLWVVQLQQTASLVSSVH